MTTPTVKMRKPLAINRIHRIDAIEGLKRLADNSVDLVVTDPPYNIASKNRLTMKSGRPMSTMEAWGAWDHFHPFEYDLLIASVINECYRVLKPGGALYMFSAREDNGFFVRQAVARGFTYRNQLAMVKKNPLPSLAKSNWRSAFEVCFYVTKGKPGGFNFISQADCKNVYQYANCKLTTPHPTEKPLPFIKLIVEVNSNKGDLVLDPFMGSGTTAVAAKELDRNFIGFELSPEYILMANQRLKGGGKNGKTRTRVK